MAAGIALNRERGLDGVRGYDLHDAGFAFKVKTQFLPGIGEQIQGIGRWINRTLFGAPAELIFQTVARGHDDPVGQIDPTLCSRFDFFNAMLPIEPFRCLVQHISGIG